MRFLASIVLMLTICLVLGCGEKKPESTVDTTNPDMADSPAAPGGK
ncbi:hypothetical protein LOC68_11970 [Blastopirellula sp. JC732]|uniref:Uncharacterized protein n=1 Tax=Blastopirellula sediminis TaxID=2894196 RepID=A0A9X1MM43_9BACT|nr:hypothetical protein [Blastopirellula sediminis]MCC9607591.1 hypothetical protein [Blastopirellula sediminis]MCC9629116.1 hypothetical protein [Blastopirellula sediminis]